MTDALASSTLVELAQHRAQHEPDRTAYVLLESAEVDGVRLTYRQLDEQARKIAVRLQQLGAEGERVLLLLPTSFDYVASFFGCLYAGAVAVPAFPPRFSRPSPRIQSIASDSQARFAVVADSALAGFGQRTRRHPELVGVHLLTTSHIQGICDADSWQPPLLTPDSLAYLQYTSGATAEPRGVMLSHSNLLCNLRSLHQISGIVGDSVGVSWLPMYHDMGLVGAALLAMYAGRPLILMPPAAFVQHPVCWLQAISRYQGTISGAPNFAYRMCVDKVTPVEKEALDLRTWEVAFCGSEPVDADTLERFAAEFAPCGFRRAALFPCYGLAEATLAVSSKRGSVQPAVCTLQRSALVLGHVTDGGGVAGDQDVVGCGEPLPGLRLLIVDPQSRIPCPPDRVGEIWVSGPSVAEGYWGRPEATQSSFGACPAGEGTGSFLRTGDLGFVRDNQLYVTGRIKDLIIVRGLNYYPQDIELTVQRSHPALQPDGSAAFSIPVDGEERLVLVCELRRTHRRTDTETVIRSIRRAVADDWELPVYAVALTGPGAVPRTSSGKLQRYLCREAFMSGCLETVALDVLTRQANAESVDPEAAFVAPETPVEMALAGIWTEVLGLSRVGVHDNFFELGGDSILAMRVVSHVRDAMGVSLPHRIVFDSPTIANLAAQVSEARGGARDFRAELPPLVPIDRTGLLPLSFAQERIWFLHQLVSDSSAYNVPAAVRLVGPLNRVALERGFNEVVRRHEVLRATFTAMGGRPFQIIGPEDEVRIEVLDLTGLPKGERGGQAIRMAEDDARLPFDLGRGPLLRVRLFQLDNDEHILFLAMHHIVSDAWSLGVLARELATTYNALISGQPVRLPRLPVQYVDYGDWQRKWLQGAVLETQSDYWREQLANTPVLELPTDHTRPVVQTHRGATKTFDIPSELMGALRQLSLEEGATLFMVLLAAFDTLLYRYSGQEDIAIAVPVANRDWLDTESLIGPLLNTLVMRTDLSGSPTFRELLLRVREVALEAYAHQDLPFEKLVTELPPVRDASRAPLAQIMFSLVNIPSPAFRLENLRVEPLTIDRRGAQFDLTLSVTETTALRQGSIEYNTDLFEDETISRMLGHFQTLLAGVVENPDLPISLLPMLTAGERDQLLVEWNGTRTPYPFDKCVHQLFEEQAARTPGSVAVEFEGQALTYAQLNTRANQLAHYLRRHEVGPGVLVGICVQRSLDMMVGLLGILKAGGAYVPLDPEYPGDRLAFMLTDSQARLLLTQDELVDGLPTPGTMGVVCMDEGWDRIGQESGQNPSAVVASSDLAYVIYTSGSTGQPKGVQVPHRAVVNFLTAMRERPGLGSQDVLLAVTTLAFDIAVLEVLLPLTVGARVVIASREVAQDGRRLARTVAECGATVMQATPVTWRMMLEAGWHGSERLVVLCGGEELPRDLAHQLLDGCAALWNMYGPTEAAIWSSVELVKTAEDVISIGRPIANAEMYVLDSQLQLLPIGVPGKLYIGGHGLARGYLNRPGLSEEKFIKHPFREGEDARIYDTGDLACYLPDGRVRYLGRTDTQVKIRGFRVELGEIEAVLGQHPAVRENAVVVQDSPVGDEQLVAYMVVDQAAPLTASEARSYLEDRLPRYMVPSGFVSVQSLPLTPNGKVDRQALTRHRLEREEGYAPPRNEIERRLVGIWESVLGAQPIGVQDSFFDLGGHSLLAVRLLAEVESVLGVTLPLASLFQSPTVERMARLVQHEVVAPDPSTLVPIQPIGRRPPVFFVHGLGGEVIGYARLAQLLGADQPCYGLRASGLDGDEKPYTRIEGMAAHYVEALRTLQPLGPYYLCGYSYGGIVAFEMACQLQAQGAKVAFLGLLVSYALRREDAVRQLWRPRNVVMLLRDLPSWVRDNWRRRRTPMDMGDLPEKFRRVRDAHLQALDMYRPPLYAGRVTLFRVKVLSLLRSYDPAMGWRELAMGGVDTRMIAGAHYNILEEPYVKVLAAELKSALAEAQAISG